MPQQEQRRFAGSLNIVDDEKQPVLLGLVE